MKNNFKFINILFGLENKFETEKKNWDKRMWKMKKNKKYIKICK